MNLTKQSSFHFFNPTHFYSLKIRLFAGFFFLIMLFLGAEVYNLININKIQSQIAQQNQEVEKQQLALDLKQKIEAFNSYLSGFMITKDLTAKESYEEKKRALGLLINQVGDVASTSEERKIRAQLVTTSEEYMNVFVQAVEIISNNNQSSEVNRELELLFKNSQIYKNYVFDKVDKLRTTYSNASLAAVDQSKNMLDQTAKMSARMSIISPLIVLVFSILISFFIVRSFTESIQKIQKIVALISTGDLRHKINSVSRDELGVLSRNFDLMIDHVREMLRNTLRIAASLSEHSNSFHNFAKDTAKSNWEILRSIEEISTGADQQAVHAEQSANIISVLDNELADIWQDTEGIQLISKHAEHNTLLGSQSVKELNESALQTVQLIEQVVQAMHSLSISSTEIGKVGHTITDISIQTNILSLNAAIEAARVGIHGKGFAIVAEEVRLLSQQTKASSQMIVQMIQTIQQQMKVVNSQMNSAQAGYLLQNSKVDATLTSFHSIRTSMQDMIGQMRNINQKIEHVKTKNYKLVESIEFVASVAEQTAAGVEEVNSTSQIQDASIRRIAEQADGIHLLSQQLFVEINKFKTDDIDFDKDKTAYPSG